MLHLHVRDAAGRHSLDPDRYRAALDAIRDRVGDALLLQVTTESAGLFGPAEQIAAARALAPEALSLSIRELWRDPAVRDDAAAFLQDLGARDALVQYIVYDAADLALCARLHADGTLPQRMPHMLLVLGAYAEQRSGEPSELVPLVAAVPADWRWSVCAFGGAELQCVAAAALLGGHVRVGFENNLALPSGQRATDNADAVRTCRDALTMLGLRAASCIETRRLFRDVSEAPATCNPSGDST